MSGSRTRCPVSRLRAQADKGERQMAAVTRILVVDDEESIRTFVGRALRGAGYEVLVAADGPTALTAVEQNGPFDLFVFDMMMPEMSGAELGRRLRILHPDAQILYFTGYSDVLFNEKCMLWEHEAFLDKPVTTKGLLEAVSLLLYGRTVPHARS
jgi:two-component system, cell cycle sensor histidine kinase and response regulator CckA